MAGFGEEINEADIDGRLQNLRLDQVTILRSLMTADPLRRKALEAVASLDLSDCWIGAGFVRNVVWDHLHGYGLSEPKGDVDVI